MDARRTSRVIDPKVRQVGFFTSAGQPPDLTQSVLQVSSSPVSDLSPVSNSLSPVMIIPPPRHASDNLTSSVVGVPIPTRRPPVHHHVSAVGSYDDPSESASCTLPVLSPSSASGISIGDGEFSEKAKFASSIPSGATTTVKPASVTKRSHGVSADEKGGRPVAKLPDDMQSSSKPLKEKTTKAERRALQEAQRAAKVAAKGKASFQEQNGRTKNQPSQKKDGPSVASENRRDDQPIEKDRKKDFPPPRMQFDDKSLVEKAKRRALVKQTEARNKVELFRHLPQYEHGTQLPDLESKLFQLDSMHPAVYAVGLRYLAGDIVGGNARCVAMLQAFQAVIKDYSTPPKKILARDLTAKINSFISFLIECRPLSISMGNAIRFLKGRVAKLPTTLSELEAKACLCSDIDRFINEKIVLADKVIVGHAVTKIRDGDVLLTYGSSSVVEMILLHAHELGKQFRVVVVDSRPNLEGQALVRRLVGKGLCCIYTHLNAVSYIMHEVTRVFLGAASVLSNGTAYSRVGTACVAMVAHAFSVPVLICCQAYKFHERVQLDAICSNELGDPDAIAKIPGRKDTSYLDNWTSKENLQLLNLVYDVTPSDYISMVITEYGMIPATSVPVIVREYGREHLMI